MNPVREKLGRRLRLAVIGGGPGSFIGPVHRTAARLDDRFEIVAACLSSDAARSRAAATAIGLPEERAYRDWQALLEGEAAREDGAEVVSVMTPNGLHYPIADAALDRGFDVICDKPLGVSVAEGEALARKVEATGLVFVVTYNYSQYPMVRHARALVESGTIGEVSQIHLTYVQGHNAALSEAERGGSGWRFDPAQAGASLILGDIGTHAHHLGSFVSGLELAWVLADVGTLVPGRTADDYAGLLLQWSNGARGTMWVTNAAAGAEHGLAIRIFGSKGGLEWHQEHPNELLRRRLGDFPEIQTKRLHGALAAEAEAGVRVEIGHPEGYQEAFGNLYAEAANLIVLRRTGEAPVNAAQGKALASCLPTVLDGLAGMRFIEAAIESSRRGAWVSCRGSA